MNEWKTPVLVVDDEASLRETMSIALARADYLVDTAEDLAAARKALERRPPALMLIDMRLPDGSGLSLLREVKRAWPEVEVIVLTAYADAEEAVEAMKIGAYDYLLKPYKLDEVLLVLERALERQRLGAENRRLRERVAALTGNRLVAESASMKAVRRLVERVAGIDATVLITGESGVGKEIVARMIHDLSPRSSSAFVAVNCGALPESLVEAELLGYERGAFTGADRAKPGLIESAHGGTLFLDEVAELPLAAQVKLLRVLQDQRVRRVGGRTEVEVDVRFVAATNQDLEAQVHEGGFRQDLFYRLNVMRIYLPPLRERPEDIAVLARHFVEEAAKRLDVPVPELPDDVVRRLQALEFHGNVRELQNLIERAVVMARDGEISLESIGTDMMPENAAVSPREDFGSEGLDLEAYLAEIEASLLRRALTQAGGVRMKAAELLGLSFRQFRYKAKKHGL